MPKIKSSGVRIINKEARKAISEAKLVKCFELGANNKKLNSKQRRLARRLLQSLLEDKPHLVEVLKDTKKEIALTKTPTSKEWQPIKLKSKRATLITEQTVCGECRRKISVAWRYAESNHGIVYICDKCKLVVRERSFGCEDKLKGKQDALDHAVSGGQFESNRRKH